ncbi:MAG: PHP domain-containing protein [Planctomycetes bacterium]|jgi:putative hydrolase|nr:PHP domain-containing protein [Planctomycetota bacterium]
MIKTDLHTHSIMSGHAFSTVNEMAQAARKKGIKILAITDHGPKVPGAPSEIYFHAKKHFPGQYKNPRLLFGLEANILDEKGKLDLPDKVLASLDLVAAGLHFDCIRDNGIASNTRAIISALANPLVKIIVHPYHEDFKVDLEKIAAAAHKHKKLLEINSSTFYAYQAVSPAIMSRIKTMVKAVKKYGDRLIIGSDAHCAENVGRDKELRRSFKELGLSEKDIINNDVRAVEKFFRDKSAY